MKKVLVFGITDNPGGVESVIMNYYRNINREEIQFDFLCNTDIVAYEDEINNLGGKIYRVTARSKDRKKFKEQINNFFANHAKEYYAVWVNVCSLANIDYLKFAKKYGIEKRIIHSHNSQNMDSFLRGLLHRYNRLFIKKYATDFWSCSEDASKWFYNSKIMESDNYFLLHNAIDYKNYKYNDKIRMQYRDQLNIQDKFVIGNVGRMHFQKNQSFLIDIFREVKKEKTNAVLLLIGCGEDENGLKEKVEQLNLTDSVYFLGVRSDIEKLLQAMDIFVFPSLFEGLPLALVEAQAANLRVYASENRINEKIIINEKNFNFIAIEDGPKKWAQKIIEDSMNPNDRAEDIVDLFKKSGYDIETEKIKLEKQFGKE